MKVQIMKILNDEPKFSVLCKTDYGDVSVHWIGNAPIENEIYDVEFETDKLLLWNRDIFVTEEPLTICDDNNRIKIIGDLESIDEDGYMVLRIDGSIITFMTHGIPIEKGIRIQVELEFIEVYPFDTGFSE